jgi:glycosyltransferase involved in cell wall biosynthesis
LVPAPKTVILGERASEGLSSWRLGKGSIEVGALREELGIDPGAKVVGFVGRLTRDKGIPELATAFRMLREQKRNIHLILVGTFEEGDPVDGATVAWMRGRHDVHCVGYRANPAPYFDLLDVFVFPTYREGLPTVLLEAAAAGKPVVSTRTTGVIDIVVDGITGLLVPPGNSAALAAAIARILDDEALGKRMGAAAKRLVAEQFDNSIFLNRLGDMLWKSADQSIRSGHAKVSATPSRSMS